MVTLSTTSPICIRIVLAFLQFLSCVEGITNTEIEYLEDVQHALKEIFRISESDIDSNKPKVSLLNLFGSPETKEQNQQIDETIPEDRNTTVNDMPSNSSPPGPPAAIKIGLSTVALFHEFYVRVGEYKFFEFIFGEDYKTRRIRAKNIFKSALSLMTEAACQTFDIDNLAGALHDLGNKAFHMNYYYRSVEYYSCAIAMFKDNPVYFVNRAAALTMIGRYNEAINDCYRATKLNPKYIEAFYSLGCIYFEQGKYVDAICKGFIKVLQIDKENAPAVAKFMLAECKLKDQLDWIREQITFLRKYDFLPNVSNEGDAAGEGTVLVFQAPPASEGSNASGPWTLVEEEEHSGDEIDDTKRISNFVDLFARYTEPLE